jgi:hypothetical protein
MSQNWMILIVGTFWGLSVIWPEKNWFDFIQIFEKKIVGAHKNFMKKITITFEPNDLETCEISFWNDHFGSYDLK